MARYGLPQVRKLLRKIAKENPNHVYVRPDWELRLNGEWNRTGCSYVHSYDADGRFIRNVYIETDVASIETGCIIGKMLIEDMGLDREWFNKDNSRNSYINGIIEDLSAEGITFTDNAVKFMSNVQRRQDNGRTWGEAVEVATSNL